MMSFKVTAAFAYFGFNVYGTFDICGMVITKLKMG